MLQQARSALERTSDLVVEALRSNPDRPETEVAAVQQKLKEPLIELPKHHGALFGAADAAKAGLPVTQVDPKSDQWKLIWLLWARYFSLYPCRVYEGRRASRVINPGDASPGP